MERFCDLLAAPPVGDRGISRGASGCCHGARAVQQPPRCRRIVRVGVCASLLCVLRVSRRRERGGWVIYGGFTAFGCGVSPPPPPTYSLKDAGQHAAAARMFWWGLQVFAGEVASQ